MLNVWYRINVSPSYVEGNIIYWQILRKWSNILHTSFEYLLYSSDRPKFPFQSSIQYNLRCLTMIDWWQIFMISSIIFQIVIPNRFSAHVQLLRSIFVRNCFRLIRTVLIFCRLINTWWRTVNQHNGSCWIVLRKHFRWLTSSCESWIWWSLTKRHWRMSINAWVKTKSRVDRGSRSLFIGVSNLKMPYWALWNETIECLPFNDDATENSNDGNVIQWCFDEIMRD